MKKQKIFAGNPDMAYDHCASVFWLLVLIGLCIYMKCTITSQPLYEDLVNLIINAVIFILSVITAVRVFFALRGMQFAIMTEKGIEFKNGLGSLGFVPWNDIESANKEGVLVYMIVGSFKRRHIAKRVGLFYVIVSTDFHVFPSLDINPKHGGIARTIPYPDSKFEDMLYFYRPDLKPEIRVDDE